VASLGSIPKLKLFWKGTLMRLAIGQFLGFGIVVRFGGVRAERRKGQLWLLVPFAASRAGKHLHGRLLLSIRHLYWNREH
jgi:hypothetical protein